ncbi:MAG: FAD-binding protein, partial [Planctomycetes bacterium]|nr:FAD-binding protein [Planctomycetota bacterium]
MIALGPSFTNDVPIGPRTSLRVGGRARWFAEPKSVAELVDVVARARREGLPLHLLGGGTNTLFPDETYPGVVVSTRHLRRTHTIPESGELVFETGV